MRLNFSLQLCGCALLGLAGVLSAGCRDAETASETGQGADPALVATAKLPLDAKGELDTSGGPVRVIEVPGLTPPEIVRTPLGWLSLSYRALGDPKVVSGFESALYRSSDGVNWQLLPFEPPIDNPMLQDIAYGAGRYVMVGNRLPVTGKVWTSSDALHWSEQTQGTQYVTQWRRIVYAGDRFFALGAEDLGVSQDGEHWTHVAVGTVQTYDVAYGNGRYVAVGSGPIQISEDGLNFHDVALDCALPGACVRDPSGVDHPGVHFNVVFAKGNFHLSGLVSADGVQWQVASAPTPTAYVEGWFFQGGVPTLAAWRGPGAWQEVPVIRASKAALTRQGRELTSIGVLPLDAPAPESVSAGFDDGLDCLNASCLLIGGRLLLLPPPGTAPLPDRVPRGADGIALLSEQCQISTKLECDDYAERRGCRCRPEAPAGPWACEDVSNFRCAGRFTPRADEWEISEVGDAGCACDAIDPNQPQSLGADCEQDATRCVAPLRCLAVDPPFSFGPPGPRPRVCTAECSVDSDCPSWQATGYCGGPVSLRCSGGSCQPRQCP